MTGKWQAALIAEGSGLLTFSRRLPIETRTKINPAHS
jgi:hypothetical protein